MGDAKLRRVVLSIVIVNFEVDLQKQKKMEAGLRNEMWQIKETMDSWKGRKSGKVDQDMNEKANVAKETQHWDQVWDLMALIFVIQLWLNPNRF